MWAHRRWDVSLEESDQQWKGSQELCLEKVSESLLRSPGPLVHLSALRTAYLIIFWKKNTIDLKHHRFDQYGSIYTDF